LKTTFAPGLDRRFFERFSRGLGRRPKPSGAATPDAAESGILQISK
jgi:hypothetical protein